MTTETSRDSSNGADPEAAARAAAGAVNATSSLAQMAGRLIAAVAEQAQRARAQRGSGRARPRLHPRDAARPLAAGEPLLPCRRARASEHPGGGARAKGVPLVPVVAIGGQETALFLSRGEGIARLLGLDRMFRLKVLPVSLGFHGA
jgi:hypothetical protein